MDGDVSRDHPCLLAQGDVRLPDGRGGVARDRVPVDDRVGPPHDRCRHGLVASLGVPFQAAAVLVFLVNVAIALRRGVRAGDDPWDAWTLEWATSSPPPYNFETAPVVASRRPLWDLKHPDDPDGPHE
jgi:hypothetical protein